MQSAFARRRFLAQGLMGIPAAWLAFHWPEIASAAQHGHEAVRSSASPKFEVFSAEDAVEIEAASARIIPTDDLPGARDAGVVYFIDRALQTFAADSLKTYQKGLPELQAKVRAMFPGAEKFSAAAPEQQDAVLHAMEDQTHQGWGPFDPGSAEPSFLAVLRVHTIVGFLAHPLRGGNPGGVGWRFIGREDEHSFDPPFGYYDKDYPGWQPAPRETEKK